MLFNSFSFALFFPVVTAGYFAIPARWRWAWLLAASCWFYAAFIPAYLLILGFTIVVDYVAGLAIAGAGGRRRRLYLYASLAANLGVLGLFKYFNFFNGNVAALAEWLHWNYPIAALQIALPIGLSFHTFQAMSYTIEVYRGRVPPERHAGIYALYVMFYPQLVAGPIERPARLLPQLHQAHAFDADRATAGLQLMAWGFFKKLVIADRLAVIVNQVYGEPASFSGPALLLATVLFSYQIFCDFSGYSDIAIGAAAVMGYQLSPNFRRPYSATSIGEFWSRWHISLSEWFRDYVYIPLGGNRAGTWRQAANLWLTFLLSGLWHGANWTFVVWGAIHGIYRIAAGLRRDHREKNSAAAVRFGKRLGVFSLVSFAWIFFRAETMSDAIYIASHLLDTVGWPGPGSLDRLVTQLAVSRSHLLLIAGLILTLELVHGYQERHGSVRARIQQAPACGRWTLYYGAVASLMLLGVFSDSRFIYFQF